MPNRFIKFITYAVVPILIVTSMLLPYQPLAVKALEEDQYTNSGNDEVGPDVDYSSESVKDSIAASDPAKIEASDGEVTAEDVADIGAGSYNPTGYVAPAPSNKNKGYVSLLSDKIVMNPADKKALTNIALANSALPDLKSDTSELGRLIGQSEDALNQMRDNDWDKFSKLASDSEAKFFTDNYLVRRLMASPEILAQMFNTDATAIVQQMQTEQGKQYIANGIQQVLDIQIDKRVVETLNYLVRPKDDPRGGAGHSRIQVDRIWQSYQMDSRKYSRESEVARESEREQAEQAEQTIEEYKSKSEPNQLNNLLSDAGLQQSDAMVSGTIVDNKGRDVSTFIVTDENAPIVSAHHSGQAFDISQIDSIKCTMIERRYLGSDTKTAQPPVNIKLLWQTTEGYGKDQAAVDSSINSMIQRLSGQSISELLGSMGVDYENLDGSEIQNFGDIMALIGQQFLSDAINAPAGSDIWKFNLSQVLRKIGGVVIADRLELDNQPFLDLSVSTIAELEEAVGRYSLEKKLGLPYGSLKGRDRGTVLAQIGRERIIDELNLPEGVFDIPEMNQDALLRKIGSRLIESEYGLPVGSFNKGSLAEVSEAVSRNRLSMIMSFPTTLDVDLGLADGTTARLKSGASLPDYLKLVAQAHVLSSGYAYNQFVNPDCSQHFRVELCQTNGQIANDNIFNLPQGTIDTFLAGLINDSDLTRIGIYAVSQSLENSDNGQAQFSSWLNNPNPSFTVMATVGEGESAMQEPTQLVTSSYSSALGISADDIYRIFGSDATNAAFGVYKRLGTAILNDALRNSSYVNSVKRQVLASNPGLASTVAQVEFYLNRIDTIKTSLANLKSHTNDFKNFIDANRGQLDQASANITSSSGSLQATLADFIAKADEISAIGNPGEQIRAIVDLAGALTDKSGNVSAGISAVSDELTATADSLNSTLASLQNKINAITRDVSLIAQGAYEIVTGQAQSDFRIEDLRLGDLSMSSIDLGGATIGLGEFALFLSGQVRLEDFLLSAASAKLAGSLGIPAKALKYAAIALKVAQDAAGENPNFQDIFFRAVGMAGLEETAGINAGSILKPAGDLKENKTIGKIRDGMIANLRLTRVQANATLAEGLGLAGYNLEDLMNDNFAAWSTARAKALANDAKAGFPAGTTEKFITGKSSGGYDDSDASQDEVRLLSSKLFVSEASIKAFIDRRNGHENPSIDNIYFVDHNSYLVSNTTNSSSSSVCSPTSISDPTQIIADNSFFYYDQDGQHIFNSYAAANEYRKAHQDRVIEYLSEISSSLYWLAYRFSFEGSITTGSATPYQANFFGQMTSRQTAINASKAFLAKYPNVESIKGALNSFLTGNEQYAFGKDNFFTLTNLLDSALDIPLTNTLSFLTRTASSDGDISVDYLKISGFYLLKNFAAGYINNALGFNFGSERITPQDIFGLFNGDAMSVFSRIGGAMLDDTLGIQRGTMEGILEATSVAERNCVIENAASQLLADALGINIDLTGLLSGGLGQGKVETFLNLPRGSFKGANIDALINNLTPIKFAEAFQIPMPKTLIETVDNKLKSIGKDFNSVHASRTIYQKIAAINNYSNALGYMWLDINQPMISAISTFLADSIMFPPDGDGFTLWQHEGFNFYTEDEAKALWNNFRGRLAAIDSYMGFTNNETARLLRGQITPDNYKNGIVDNIIRSGAIQAASRLLGLQEKGISDGDLNKWVNDFKNFDITRGFSTEQLSDTFSFLDKYFSVNLDDKIGAPDGMIASIIRNPETAKTTLLTFAGRKVDQMLGFGTSDDRALGSQGVFEKFTNLWFANDTRIRENCAIMAAFSPSLDYGACVSQAHWSTLVSAINHAADDYIRNDVMGWGVNKINSLVSDALKIPIQFSINGVDGSRTQNFGIQLNQARLASMFRGDMRVFGEVGIVMGLQAIYKGSGDQPIDFGNYQSTADLDAALGSFQISMGDIERVLYGNPAEEREAFVRAAADTYASMTDPNYNWALGPANTTVSQDGTLTDRNDGPNLMTDSGGEYYASVMHPNATDSAVALYITYRSGAGSVVDPSSPLYDTFQAGEREISSLRAVWKKNFQYKTIDLAMHRIDPNIPPDFARRMYEGNGWTKTTALVDYAENFLNSATGVDLPAGTLSGIANYIKNPSDATASAFMASAGTELLSRAGNWFNSTIKSSLGIDLPDGAFGALLGFAQTGSLDGKLTFGGQEYSQSLNRVATDWAVGKAFEFASKILKVPVNDLYSLYNASKEVLQAYNTWKIARTAETLANFQTSAVNLVVLAVQIFFSDELVALDRSLNLPPGTMSQALGVVGMLIVGTGGVALVAAVGMLLYIALFGVYRVDLQCTADGYYPSMESAPDPSVWDNGGLGVFDGMNAEIRQKKFVEAAQYKANKLVQDLYMMPARTGKETLVPTQVMTGRWEDVNMWAPLTADTICKKVGSGSQTNGLCSGTKAGMWANPQTTAYTHVGF